ncbi:hypothetical protein IWX90DRAFT_489611 [Phyllosticta citrichinensis]|uniref:Uncharacterized protein n=1 Tax=Phyllosticta citrichinensis TaxID=1130410 RepID=A0ABR1XJW4_9PEZI
MSTSTTNTASNVIDLTSDDDTGARAAPAASTRASRPPRFPREIIDLCEDEPQNEQANNRQRHRPPPSPEVEVTFARRVPRDQRSDFEDAARFFDNMLEGALENTRRSGGVNGGLPRFPQPPHTNRHTLDHYNQILNDRTSVRRANAAAAGGRSRSQRSEGRAAHFPHLRRAVGVDPDDILGGMGDYQAPRLMMGLFNYTQAAFDLGNEREPTPATYSAPEAAGPGYTRSPEENEVLVCPNCDAELCAGDEGSLKRQVWIIKACGHAYCGECTTFRTQSKRKGKDRVGLFSTFSKCVVKGCEKKCSNRTHMIQLFL